MIFYFPFQNNAVRIHGESMENKLIGLLQCPQRSELHEKEIYGLQWKDLHKMNRDDQMEIGQAEVGEERDWGAQARDEAKLIEDTDTMSWGLFCLFSSSYLLQGIISGFSTTMPYVYPSLPDVDTMALFNASLMPFSFKFLIAPFMEKFAPVEYGKRKIYMLIGLGGAGLVLMVCSFLTDQAHAKLFAVLIIISQTMMALLDIATHALMVKQLGSIGHASIILSYGQTIGIIIGTMIILKFTSQEFASSIGLDNPITTPQVIITIFAILFLVLAAYIQFCFTEKVLYSERRGSRFSFCEIICHYKIFFRIGSRYCRMCIMFLLYLQGFNFFNSLYDYELVKRGFSRDTANTMSIIISIPIAFLTFAFPSMVDCVGGRTNAYRVSMTVTILFSLAILIWFPLEVWWVGVVNFATNFTSSWYFFVSAVQINEYPVNALSGMFITFMASCANLGQNVALHTEIAGKLGWELCSYIGLGYQLILVILMKHIMGWVYEGDLHVPPQIEENPDGENQELIEEGGEERVEDRGEGKDQIKY